MRGDIISVVLITGGAGFIGSNYIKSLLKTNTKDQIVCLDSLTYAGNIETLSNIESNNFKFIRADIRNKVQVNAVFEKYEPDIVINFAAESHVDRSIKNPQIFLETNVIGTSILMDASIKHEVRRFHQVSTDEVYGDLPLNRPDLLFTESTPLNASSPYSSSKASADLLAMAYYRTYGFPVSISRCSNNYGPYQFPEKLIPLMITKAFNNEKMPVYGDGLNVRDWLHVDDHCNAIRTILSKGKAGQIYNVGGNNEVKNIDIVKIILNELGKSEDLIAFVSDRKGHDRRYAIDATKMRNLGWVPKINFNVGIIETIEWYLSNKSWCERIVSGAYQKSNDKVNFIS